MESRKLEIILHSAKNLDNVKIFGTMDPYAVIWITGGDVASEIYKTKVAKKAGGCPVWDYRMVFNVNPTKSNNYNLCFEIQHDGKLFDRMIGEVQVPFTKLVTGDEVSYPVNSWSGEVKGEIIVSCNFVEPVLGSMEKGVSGSGIREGGRPGKKVEEKKTNGVTQRLTEGVAISVATKLAVDTIFTSGTTVAAVFDGQHFFGQGEGGGKDEGKGEDHGEGEDHGDGHGDGDVDFDI